ncbi:MAG: UPF0182 family protein [Firmicutes bacterium]|nr:UPF0182 family protein [Bacillota bacterium]
MRRRTIWIMVAGIALVLLGLAGVGFYLDLLWFKELHFEGVFWTQHLARWGLRLVSWLFLFSFMLVNFLFTRRYILSFPNLALRQQLIARGYLRFFTPRRLNIFFLVLSAFFSFVLSGYTGGHWMNLMRFIHAAPFNSTDPIFGMDISFYLFKIPFYRFIYDYLMMAAVFSLILVGIIYIILNIPASGRRWLLRPGSGLGHLSVLLAAIFALKAWDYHLKQFELLLSGRGAVFGAGYTDIHANFPVLKVLMFLAILISLLCLANLFLRHSTLPFYGIPLLMIVSILGGWAYPAAIQYFMVEPGEFNYEKEYLAHNIAFTRQAYGLDKFSTRQYPAGEKLTWEDLQGNPGTINNVRLWDYRPLKTTFNEQQAIRPYYRFFDVDIDRYNVEGNYRQVMLSARELDKNALAEQAQTWVNLHLQYTHGYGATASPVNEVSAEGLPRYFLGDIPPAGDIPLQNPSIYYGELTNDYVIVNTNTREFHYSTAGDENTFTIYDGEGGIPLHSLWRRILFALKFGEYRILVSGELNNNSRILFDRDIYTRVKKIAPFLHYDGNPYIVIHDGRLFWIQDAYTITDRYPYAAPHGSINYIRNSVKVVVDAYHGSVKFYLIDSDDPLAQNYSRIFPGLFTPAEEMPQGLLQHLRYPVDLFKIQSDMITLYHVTDPNTFYAREDLWNMPMEQYYGEEQQMEPYYTILQLPGYEEAEFVLILPFTPSNRNNMIAWMVARCDQPNYGQVELFLFPKERVVMGPKQVENRIDQSTEISTEFTLWSQAGSHVIRGNLLVLPISDSLLYVEPIFLEAERGGLPELARVIVLFQETVVMEETLELALVRIFGERSEIPPEAEPLEPAEPGEIVKPGEPDSATDQKIASLIRQACRLFDEALQHQRQGDWAGYGEAISELEGVLKELADLTGVRS